MFDNNDEEDKSEPTPQKPEKNGKQAPPPSSQPQLYYKRGQKVSQLFLLIDMILSHDCHMIVIICYSLNRRKLKRNIVTRMKKKET